MKILKTIIDSKKQETLFISGSSILDSREYLEELEKMEASQFLVLSDKKIFSIHGQRLLDSLKKCKKDICISLLNEGENQKNLNSLQKAFKPFFLKGFDRRAVVICIGGGVICDMGGFMASILLRGLKVVYIPTTLLAQIDAAIGGKTGVNFSLSKSVIFKNMIGTIKQPNMVISDIALLKTLPKNEIDSAIGEIFKYHIIFDNPKFDMVKSLHENIYDDDLLLNVIEVCQKLKIDCIKKDPLDELHIREKLNLGR
jgi:3-dehydroquinate synthetase